MLRGGIGIVLAALAVGLAPSAAFSQNIMALEGYAPPASVFMPDGTAYQVKVFGPRSGPRVVVAQNLVTPNGTAPVPNVNDCTFIRDPIALRDCINLYEGQRLAPGPRIGEPRTNLITDEKLIDAAGPIPGSGKGASGNGGRDSLNASDPKRPDAAYIEQVRPSR